jgi:hypothetical protein
MREERGAARQTGRRVAGPVLLRSRKRKAKVHGFLPAVAEKNERRAWYGGSKLLRACVLVIPSLRPW